MDSLSLAYKKIKSVQLVYLLIFLLCGLSCFGQTKVGYIDYDKVVLTLPEHFSGKKKIESLRKRFEDSIIEMSNNFRNVLDSIHMHDYMTDSISLMAIESKLKAIETRIKAYQNFALDEICKEEKLIQSNLKNKISTDLEKYMESNGILRIEEKEAVLYCRECIDYTEDFIAYMKTQDKK